ncbi:MAG: 30S ribosomal protein S16 [Erysipelotrichaceae bacterium]|nr:30S ribosomal protein S16 [Erysipelotrichaceae bacterium]
MVKIRLKRMGAKQKPFYRIVASDSRNRRDSGEIETVGTYDVTKNPAIVAIDREKALKWLKNGAVPTDTVRNLFQAEGIMKEFAESKKAAK